MKRRRWIAPGIVILVLGVVVYRFRFPLLFFLITPVVDFRPEDVPPPPDYANLKFWAMHPEKDDPTSASDHLRVFWIHPTTLLNPLKWNENPDDGAAKRRFRWSLENQASLFTRCCRVYAPHYRQATLAAFWKTAGGFPARALAYSDVKRAFDRFLAEDAKEQPFVIAGHSQGAEHGLRLLQERISGHALQKRLIAAYLVGTPVHQESLRLSMPDIPVCSHPQQTACVISWSTFKETTNSENFFKKAVWPQGSGYHSVSGEFVCVNPVSWLLDGQTTSPEQHQGARLRKKAGLKIKARCERGALLVDDVDEWLDISMGGNYHLDDIALFYYDIENNVQTRRDAFLKAH